LMSLIDTKDRTPCGLVHRPHAPQRLCDLPEATALAVLWAGSAQALGLANDRFARELVVQELGIALLAKRNVCLPP
jgi:hypothetical protein